MPEGFSFDDDDSYNRFTFENVGADNAVNRLTFQAETWTEALEKFIQFLRGSGYFIDYDSIAINEKKHYGLPTQLIPSYYPEDEVSKKCTGTFNGAVCDDLPKIDPEMINGGDDVLNNLYAMKANIEKAIAQHKFDKGE